MVLSNPQISQILVSSGKMDQAAVAEHEKKANEQKKSLDDYLIEKGLITDEELGKLTATAFKLPFVNVSSATISDEVFQLLPERLARSEHVVVFAKSDKSISVAMVVPRQLEVFSMLSKKTGRAVEVAVATKKDIETALKLYKRDLQKVVDALIAEDMPSYGSQGETDDPPVAKIVDALINSAYQDKTSDIHMEAREKDAIVRLRIDGVLHDVLTVSKYLHDRMVTRIKVLSSLRTDEHYSAQDGKMRIDVGAEKLDIRVSIIPIVEGEKVVMRLLSTKTKQLTLTDLGMSEANLATVKHAYTRSFGMILSTGPTGSGKTTSIYSMLLQINTREKNLTSIEDPVEYRIAGANQVQVNTKTNLTFANGLRSLLRQDPNIILVGEIRDNETAGIAVNAALTGHLVFSTLHTNDAATAIPRLIDMKVEPFLVASTVNIIIAQRLVRKICDVCRISHTVTLEELSKDLSKEMISKHYTPVGKDGEIRMYKGKGCKACHQTGYQGRLGIYEVLEVSKPIRELVAKHADSDVILQEAIKEGMTTMQDDGLQKVAQGLTTLEEILRVTKTELV